MTLHAACSPGEIRIAAVMDGELLDYAIWRPGRPDGVGDVHRGRVTTVVPGMAGAFVALARPTASCRTAPAPRGRGVGDVLAVRIVRAAQGGKGPRAGGEPGRTADRPARPAAPGRNPVATAGALHPGPVQVDDAAVAAALRPDLGDRVRGGACLA